MKNRITGILILWIATIHSVSAQHAKPGNDTTINGSVIEVIQSYKPKVKQAPKPEWIPQLPPADTNRLPIVYKVPQQTLYYSYTSEPLHPLALGKDSMLIPYPNYIKGGVGNLATLFLDAGIGGLYGKNYETAIHVHHLSQEGTIKYQQTSLTGLETDGILHAQHYDWHAGLDVERNQYYYYGYNHSVYDYASDSVRQTYTTVRVNADMKNKINAGNPYDYDPAISASYYSARFNTSESSFGLNVPVSYKINNVLQAQVTLSGAETHYSANGIGQDNSYFELLPGVNYHKGNLTAHVYLGLASGIGSMHIIPDIVLSYPIQGSSMLLSGGLIGTLRQNSYEQLTTENPYLFNYYQVKQLDENELFMNLTGNTGKHLYYSARASWWNYNNLPTYLNDTFDQKQFFVYYDNVNAESLQLSGRYVVANTWSAGLSCQFYEYYQGTLSHVWGQPATKIKGDFVIKALPNLSFTAYLAIVSGIYALDVNKHTTNLGTIPDLGGNGEYYFKPNFSAFLQINNLLNNKVSGYYEYTAYGINIYAGIRLKF